jgi:ribosomal protein L3 glutamine methyltransferase
MRPAPTAGTPLPHVISHCRDALVEGGVAFGHGTTNAHDEACWLVLWALQQPLDSNVMAPPLAQHQLSAKEAARIQALLTQRIARRVPLAYLTGEAWLQGVPFDIDARSIVPRSLLAEPLAEGVFDDWLGAPPTRVLDLCTGNGSLAVLAALAWPHAQVTGSDISADALALARRNGERHGVHDRIVWQQADGLSATADDRFDLILCNPPYVNAQSMAALPPEFRAEPALALHGGADGMDFLRRVLPRLPQHLQHNGVCALEIGHEYAHFTAAFAGLEAVCIETSGGEDAVLLLSATSLQHWAASC